MHGRQVDQAAVQFVAVSVEKLASNANARQIGATSCKQKPLSKLFMSRQFLYEAMQLFVFFTQRDFNFEFIAYMLKLKR